MIIMQNKQTNPNLPSRESWEAVKRDLGIVINPDEVERDAKAAQRVTARKEETQIRLPMIIEQEADYEESNNIAKKHNGALIKLERLPQLLNDPDFVESIESTESYKRDGYIRFWIDTVGTNLDGHYRMNPQGKTLDEMFTFISDSFDINVEKIPHNERAHFRKRNQPLSVNVRRSDFEYWRLIVGDLSPSFVAPVVVVEQASVQPVAIRQRIIKFPSNTLPPPQALKYRYPIKRINLNQMPKAIWEAVKRGLGIVINTEQIERDAKAAQRVAARKEETQIRLPMVIEQEADYKKSKDIAKKHNGALIKLERLVQLLNDPDFVESIEGTESYKTHGGTSFCIATKNVNLKGHYRMNPQGKTLDEMFTFISDSFDEKVEKIPFNERAYFLIEDWPLYVIVNRSGVGKERLYVYGEEFNTVNVLMVVVVDQDQAESATTPATP